MGREQTSEQENPLAQFPEFATAQTKLSEAIALLDGVESVAENGNLQNEALSALQNLLKSTISPKIVEASQALAQLEAQLPPPALRSETQHSALQTLKDKLIATANRRVTLHDALQQRATGAQVSQHN